MNRILFRQLKSNYDIKKLEEFRKKFEEEKLSAAKYSVNTGRKEVVEDVESRVN